MGLQKKKQRLNGKKVSKTVAHYTKNQSVEHNYSSIMKTKYKPASEESRKALYENMGKTFSELEVVIRYQLLFYETLKVNIDKKKSTNTENLHFALMSLSVYSQFINIELLAVLRSCFRATCLFERRYNLKFVNIIMLEGYKHLYGYKNNRRKSLWYKFKPLLNVIDDDEFKKDYLALNNKIKEFGEKNVTNKDQRDFAIHYDDEPLAVYKMLIDLSEEEEVLRVFKFWDLLAEVSSFTLKYQNKYKVDVIIKSNIYPKTPLPSVFYNLFENKKMEFYISLEKHIENQSDKLNYFVKLQEFPVFLRNNFNDIGDDYLFYIDKLIEVIKVSIQLLYLYIDLASATRAFIISENVLEKQIAMKQMNIITYEGFNKLYGVKEEKELTFFKLYLHPIIDMVDDEVIVIKLSQLEKDLNSYEIELKSKENQRHMSVHYDNGVDQIYNMLQDFNPLIEFNHTKKLLDLLPRIFDCSSDCAIILSLKQKDLIDKKNAKTNESIDEIVRLLERSQASGNLRLIKLLKDLKSGEYFKHKFLE